MTEIRRNEQVWEKTREAEQWHVNDKTQNVKMHVKRPNVWTTERVCKTIPEETSEERLQNHESRKRKKMQATIEKN